MADGGERARGPAVCRYQHTSLPPETSAVGVARRWVTDLLTEWDLTDAVDDLRLVVSELVSNAVLHARTVIDVALSIAEGVLELSVSDRDPRTPRPRPQHPEELATGGRGLLLVASLSDDWGIAERMTGKEVWFRRTAPSRWRYAAACVCPDVTDDLHKRSASGHRVVLMDPDALPGTT